MVLWDNSLQRDFALEQDQRHPNQMPLVQVKCFPMKNHELCLTLLQSCTINCFLESIDNTSHDKLIVQVV